MGSSFALEMEKNSWWVLAGAEGMVPVPCLALPKTSFCYLLCLNPDGETKLSQQRAAMGL